MNQNLFRQFVYANTNSLGNWLTIRGEGIHETGPFTLRDLHSRELVGRLEFQVGRPWGKTSLLTGYVVDDLLFRPLVREWFSTSSYVGVERRLGQKLTVRALAQYIRGWRVQELQFVLGAGAAAGRRNPLPAEEELVGGRQLRALARHGPAHLRQRDQRILCHLPAAMAAAR